MLVSIDSTTLYFFVQIILSAACGLAVGWQRHRSGKSAGARTYAFVAIASTLITRVSMDAFVSGDPARLASQILPGIGFLGAGMIIHKERSIEGLTTAAAVWAMAGIGIAIGAGWLWESIFVTMIIFLLLWWDEERNFHKKKG